MSDALALNPLNNANGQSNITHAIYQLQPNTAQTWNAPSNYKAAVLAVNFGYSYWDNLSGEGGICALMFPGISSTQYSINSNPNNYLLIASTYATANVDFNYDESATFVIICFM